MRDELIQIIRQSLYGMLEIHLIDEIAPRVADYLLDNGVVVLPFKVGDIVWVIHNGYVSPAKIIAVYIDHEGLLFDLRIYSENRQGADITTNCLAENIFKSREEAEAHVEEMKV